MTKGNKCLRKYAPSLLLFLLFEAVAVTLCFCLLESSVVFFSHFCLTVCEIIMLYTDQFIRLSSEDFSHMTSRTIIFLEKVVSGDFICGDGIFLSFQITVEA